MPFQYKQDPQTGLVRQSWSIILIGGMYFFIVLVSLTTIFPYFSKYVLYTSIPMGILGFGSLVWINAQPNLYARFFLNIGISGLCMQITVRAFENLFPDFSFWGASVIILTTIGAHTLPMWNSSIAKFIRDELSAPKTKLGKIVFRVSLFLIPFIGVLGAILEMILHRQDKTKALSFILLSIFWFLAIGMPFAYRFPSSPWERNLK